QIQTEIDSYRSSADAREGLAFWRRDELKNGPLKKLGFHISVRKVQLSGVPKPNWAYAESVSLSGLKPIEGVDAAFQVGRYVLDVSAAGGSTKASVGLVPTVAHRFEQRLRLALAGRLKAKAVKLPVERAGPPAHGPKPAGMVLRAADGGKGSKVIHKGYSKPKSSFDENDVSVYQLAMELGGSSPQFLSQEVLVGGSKLEAEYFAAVAMAGFAASGGSGAKATSVDLGDVGDNARGELLKASANGQTAYEAVISLSRGSYLDFLVLASASAVTAADVHNLAHVAAKRLNAAFAG